MCFYNTKARWLTCLKTLHPEPQKRPVLVEELDTKAPSAEQPIHPHVVKILEIGRLENQHFRSMEYRIQNFPGKLESDRQIAIEILIEHRRGHPKVCRLHTGVRRFTFSAPLTRFT